MSVCVEMGRENSKKEVHFLKKPLYFWTKSFADKEIRREDSFSKFLTSNALNYALEYIGIATESEQSSLHLSAIFEEETGTGQSSLSSNSSRTTKYANQVECETKNRIQVLNSVFNELKSYFEDHFSQLVLIRPPNSVHITTACEHCSIAEYEKILLLLLGASIQGTQKQDTIRKIKGFPKEVQESLIESIKNATDNPELIHIKPWSEYCTLDTAAQQRIYDNLLSQVRRLLIDRNDVVQAQFFSDYFCGFTNCDQRRNYEYAKESGNAGDSLDFDKYSDENRASAAMRQLREELLEKSDLLQECREELEMTKIRVQELQNELSDTRKQLRSCKKSRDEFDVLREGQEKALRLEAELQRMKKKLEDSEQYYERVEILQNENRNHQRKHAILMDQINMLTVEKERIEVSFLTQQHNRSLSGHFSQDEIEDFDRTFNRTNTTQQFEDELILSDTETGNSTTEIITELLPTRTPSPSPDPDAVQIESFQTEMDNADRIPDTNAEVTEGNAAEIECIVTQNEACQTQNVNIDNENGNESEFQDDQDSLAASESCTETISVVPTEIQEHKQDADKDEAIVPQQGQKQSKSDKRRSKRGSRRTSSLHVKRTRKSLFGPSKVVLQKASHLSSTEKLDELALLQQMSESNSPMSSPRKGSGRRHRGSHVAHHSKRSTKEGKQVVPNLDVGDDADAELSLSPTVHRHFSSSSGSEAEALHQHGRSAREAFTKRGSPPRRVPGSGNHVSLNLTPLRTSRPSNPPPDQHYGPLEDSENEFFFVCSTTKPATARNVKISKGRNVPLVQLVSNENLTPTQPPQDVQRRQSIGSDHGGQREFPDRDDALQALSRCNIQVSLRHVNTNSHQFSLGNNNQGEEFQQMKPVLPVQIPNRSHYSNPLTLNLAHHGHVSPKNESSSEDDESVWYEYGCV